MDDPDVSGMAGIGKERGRRVIVKIVLFANTDWYLYNFRRSLAKALTDAGHELLLVSPPGPYGEMLQAMGFRWMPAPMERASLNPLRELVLLIWLWRVFRREKVDLVHGFTIKCAIYGAIVARLSAPNLGGVARVSAVAGLGYVFTNDGLKARALRPLVRLLLRVAFGGRRSRLILQNPDDVKMFLDAGLMEARDIRLIPGSGVDCARFLSATADGAASVRSSEFNVLLPARLLWDKGVGEFVEAARLLKSQGREITFLLAGAPDPGNPAAIPESVIRQWVEEGVVLWLGHVEDMPALFRSVSAVVLPSYREGLPKGLIEAAACGLPLVTTDAPGCREVVTHEVDGLLVPVRDPRAIAAAVSRLQDDGVLRDRLGQAAKERARGEFDERIIIRKTMDVYGEVAPLA